MTGAILWDMDGTLLDSEPAHAAAFNDAIAELGLSVPRGFHDALLGASADSVLAALVEATAVELTLDAWLALKWRHMQYHASCIQRREPAASIARRLAERRVPMALVSNSSADEIMLALSTTDLLSTFPITISRGDVVAGKPAPDGYLLAARILKVAPENCLVIEDSHTGAQAGLAAGMQVIFHPEQVSPSPPQGSIVLAPDGSAEQWIDGFLQGRRLVRD